VYVCGRRRVPAPATGMMAFIGPLTPKGGKAFWGFGKIAIGHNNQYFSY